ncbi:helix-turn-helix domain-containing protein [Streptomyces rubiginosohelvolus]|uniref:helix-turn-helix domain-containing protein n=1 Tax=Streptomyces rubiginosohelvolus TaxID=67362 RepID=UPI0035DA4D69
MPKDTAIEQVTCSAPLERAGPRPGAAGHRPLAVPPHYAPPRSVIDTGTDAGLVRALKAGDGRSFEALGRRPSVNASTLHRYCSGATVPEEFAMIDRLLLLCEADEETVGAVVDDGLPLRPKPVRHPSPARCLHDGPEGVRRHTPAGAGMVRCGGLPLHPG